MFADVRFSTAQLDCCFHFAWNTHLPELWDKESRSCRMAALPARYEPTNMELKWGFKDYVPVAYMVASQRA